MIACTAAISPLVPPFCSDLVKFSTVALLHSLNDKSVTRSEEVLSPHNVSSQSEAINEQVRSPDHEPGVHGGDGEEGQRVDGGVAEGGPGGLGLVLRHPVGLGDVVADKVKDELDHLGLISGSGRGRKSAAM